MTIRYFKIPVQFLAFGITSVVELMILSLAVGFGDKGIKISNARLAIILRTTRRNVIKAVNRLVRRGYLIRKSAGYGKRVLIVNGEKVSLVNSVQLDTIMQDQIVSSCSQNSVRKDTKMVNARTPISKGIRKYKGLRPSADADTRGGKPTTGQDDTDWDAYDACARSLTHDADPDELDEIFKGMPK